MTYSVGSMMRTVVFIGKVLFLGFISCCFALIRFNSPKDNVWVTFANKTNQSSFCLALGGAGNPFRTCLIGVPVWQPQEFRGFVNGNCNISSYKALNASCGLASFGFTPQQQDGAVQCRLIHGLNITLASPPEELDLFGCLNASTNGSKGGWLSFEPLQRMQLNQPRRSWATLDSSLQPTDIYQLIYSHCNGSNITAPLQLPPGIFLICGDRAWNGIPVQPKGGPCYLGKLALFHPNLTNLMLWANKSVDRRNKRNIHELQCADVGTPMFWSEFGRVAASAFFPGLAATKALKLAEQLACWTKNELNLTSNILDELSADVQSVNHAVLQNRAAIDYLLLAQGHGCEEFEGMCCMNLSDHSSSIHRQLNQLRQELHQLKQEDGLGIDDWLKSLGLGPWLRSLIVMLAGPALILILMCILGPCLLQCLVQRFQNIAHALFEKRGGDVGVLHVNKVYKRI